MNINKALLSQCIMVTAALLSAQVYGADAFVADDQPLGYVGAVELSKSNIELGDAKAYRGWFENGAWQGDLIEYNVTSAGALSTTINLTGTSPSQDDANINTQNWSAHVMFADNEDSITDYWSAAGGRKIITTKNGAQIPFRWTNLSASQKQALDSIAYNNGTPAASSDMLDFVRGDRGNEYPAGSYRLRTSILGDVMHSNPEYVGTPQGDIGDSSYAAFSNLHRTRLPRVYVGANDGMLHAFDAANGNEVWAYIPSMLIDNLPDLAARPFSHKYFVDGKIVIQDAYYNGAWHTVLVGSLGSGGKGMYALDVTDPTMASESSSKVLWEIDGDNADVGAYMGHIFSDAVIARMNDGNSYFVFGNGVGSSSGKAALILVNIATGKATKIEVSGSAASPGGLSAPALVDGNNDGLIDFAYAGDIDGDLWKFDLAAESAGGWKKAYKLYNGDSAQPITTAPDVTTHPVSGFLVFFGTGRLYTDADITDTSSQSLLGIRDTLSDRGGINTLLVQTVSDSIDFISSYNGLDIAEQVRTITSTVPINWSTHTGWQVPLTPAGLRLVTPAQLRAGRVKALVTNPDGYENWLFEVYFKDGGPPTGTIFDLKPDGILDNTDRVDGNSNSSLLDSQDIPIAWQRQEGTMSEVTIARIDNGVDTLFINFLNPPAIPDPCSGDCPNGIEGGHFDLDTDSPTGSGVNAKDSDGLFGKTDGHEHEYDDKTGRTYADYLDLHPDGFAQKLKNIDEVGFSDSEEFIVLIANADLSPGAELTLGANKYNVVEYQKMIQQKLAAWDGSSALTDGSNSLIHTINSIRAAGTIRNTFDSLAIYNGGLHPTETGCVNKDKNGLSDVNGRWRNGALVTTLVKRSFFGSGIAPFALDKLTVQNPTDLKTAAGYDGQVSLTEDLNGVNGIEASNYEIYGGLLVKNNAEFLYESTLFWHYGDVVKYRGETVKCYGEIGWEAAVATEIAGLTQEEADAYLLSKNFDNIEALNAAIQALIERDCHGEGGSCKKDYKKLLEIKDLADRVVDIDGSNSSNNNSSDPDGTPVVMEGGVSEAGVTSGPNFETGRRTWIDITPQ